MSKYYAVRHGKKTGIFETWAECESQVKGFSGAEYKSFSDKKSAQEFLNEKSSQVNNFEESMSNSDSSALKVYVDGSYSRTEKKASYGCVFIDKGIIVEELSEVVVLKGTEDLWNVTGELNGAIAATEWAINRGYKSIVIHYDYEGIEKWYKGIWKANKISTQLYKDKMLTYSNNINITFVKVKAHSGDYYNELADQLAKKAIDLKNKEEILKSNPEIVNAGSEFKKLYKDNVQEKDFGQVQFKIKDYILNDKIINKIVKSIWRSDGNLMKELKSYSVTINTSEKKIEMIFIKSSTEKITRVIDI